MLHVLSCINRNSNNVCRVCMFNSKQLLCVYKHTFHKTVLQRGALTKRVFAEVSVTPLALVICTGSPKISPSAEVKCSFVIPLAFPSNEPPSAWTYFRPNGLK